MQQARAARGETVTEELKFAIENVMGIERAELILKPGVNVLTGRNAIGKTSAMLAIVRASGGGGELERRDGAARGVVEGPGVRLTIGKVVRTTGAAELSLADVSPLSRLIDPGLQSSEAAARARIRALIDLLQLPVDDAACDALCQGDESLRGWLAETVQEEAIDDLMTASEKLRGQAHSRAREAESVAERCEGEASAAGQQASAALETLGGHEHLVDISPADARAALIGDARQFERLEAQCEGREQLEARQAELRATIGERPDWEAAEKVTEEAKANLAKLLGQFRLLEEKISIARTQVTDHADLAQRLRALADRWDRAQEILQREPEGLTRGELATERKRLIVESEERLRLAGASHSYRTAMAVQVAATEAKSIAAVRAESLRELASSIPAVLGALLSIAGAGEVTVIGDRLHALIDGEPVDWERRLSDGQRIRLALDIAARVYDGVVPLDDVYWGALDPANRAEFAKLAQERGLYVLTEQASDGPLRVESETGDAG
jgi:hypothetical protein